MRTWTISNQKGGVGKTTTVVTLAGIMSGKGHKTLMVDMDPHGSLTSYFGLDPDAIEYSVYELFQDRRFQSEAEINRLIWETRFDNLYLLPASTAMATLDRQLGAQNGKGLVILHALAKISVNFSHTFIDCPPNLGILMVNALAACEKLIIPVQTEFLALKGLERMLNTITMISRSRQYELPFTILPTMFDKRTRASLRALRNLQQKYPENIARSVIPVNTQFREASQMGVPLPLLDSADRGVKAYKNFLDELLMQQLIRNKAEAVVI